MLSEFWKNEPINWSLEVVYKLEEKAEVVEGTDSDFLKLAEVYYDPKAETRSTRVGGTDVKRGFNACSLPLVVYHNTPNNSLFLLWADPEKYKWRGLFPRVERHGG